MWVHKIDLTALPSGKAAIAVASAGAMPKGVSVWLVPGNHRRLCAFKMARFLA